MNRPALLFHYGPYQPLWQQPGLLQCGPRLALGPHALPVAVPTVEALMAALRARGLPRGGVLIHYTDPFLMRAAGLRGLRQWPGPRLLVCGDLHHGPAPIDTLANYLQQQFHDAVLLAFNPMLLEQVRARLSVPVHCHPPGFFRYPSPPRHPAPRHQLVHVGSLGPHHPQRRSIVEALQRRARVPFEHITTASPEQAAAVYAANALVLNIPLNNDLNHRFFEVMAAGAPQLIFGSPALLGPLQELAHRPDLTWVHNLQELETVARQWLQDPQRRQTPVAPPPQWPLEQLLRICLAPSGGSHPIAP